MKPQSPENFNTKSNFLEKFNTFFKEIQNLESDDGFVKASKVNDIYNDIFKKEASGSTTLSYRLRTLAREFPDDILVDPDVKLGDSKYYIKKDNRKLLDKIYAPASKKREDAEIIKEIDHKKDLEALRDFGILNDDEDDEW